LIQVALACAHARSGDPALIAVYLGKGDAFGRGPMGFGMSYADQAEKTTPRSMKGGRSGRVDVQSSTERGRKLQIHVAF
jgi:hypothetical protein